MVRGDSNAIDRGRLVNNDLLLTRAREEHAVDFVTVGTVNIDVLAVKSLHKDVLGLVEASKDELVAAEAATTFRARPDPNLQVLRQIDQRLNVPLV